VVNASLCQPAHVIYLLALDQDDYPLEVQVPNTTRADGCQQIQVLAASKLAAGHNRTQMHVASAVGQNA